MLGMIVFFVAAPLLVGARLLQGGGVSPQLVEQALLLSLLLETIVNTVKWAMENGFNVWRVAALALGVVITPLTGVNAFAAVGIPLVVPAVPWIGNLLGCILTGLILSRGSNVAADLFKAVKSLAQLVTQKVEVQIRS